MASGQFYTTNMQVLQKIGRLQVYQSRMINVVNIDR